MSSDNLCGDSKGLFNEMDDPLKPDRSKDTSDDEDKDNDEEQ